MEYILGSWLIFHVKSRYDRGGGVTEGEGNSALLSVIRFASERSADAEGNSPMVSETVGQAMN